MLLFLAMEARAQQRLERKKALDEKKRKTEEEKLVCEHPLLLFFAAFFWPILFLMRGYTRKHFRRICLFLGPIWSNLMYFVSFLSFLQ